MNISKTYYIEKPINDEEWEEIGIEVQAHVVFDRPAPACSNPSDPRFSDPGDPGEVDIHAMNYEDSGENIEYDSEVWKQVIKENSDISQELYDEACENIPSPYDFD